LQLRSRTWLPTQHPPPKELTTLLQADDTFQAILKVAVDDKEAILIRRYVKVIHCPC
jgi:hypothetical protein